MDKISINIDIDISTEQIINIKCNQYENNSREIVCSLYDNENVFVPPVGMGINVRMSKQSGTKIIKTIGTDGFGSMSSNIITIPIISAMTAAHGRHDCELEFFDGNGTILHTYVITLIVSKSAINNADVEDTNDYSTIYEKAVEASASAANALSSANIATTKASNASASATSASSSATSASTSESNAMQSKINASASAANALSSANIATTKASQASSSATLSESFAKGNTNARDGENIDNAKYYLEQARRISEGLSGSLLPMGTISFAELPQTSTSGYMYNISDEFVTDSRFKEGAGNLVPVGANVYYTTDGYWDCMAGSPVTGIKGNNESSYRRGNVNITKDNIGLGNVENLAQSDQVVNYVESTELSNMNSGETMATAFGKIKKAITTLISHVSDTVKHITPAERTLWNKASDDGLNNNLNNIFKKFGACPGLDFKLIMHADLVNNLDRVRELCFSGSTDYIGYIGMIAGAGVELLFGIEYPDNLYGTQIRLTPQGAMLIRGKNNSQNWTVWTKADTIAI